MIFCSEEPATHSCFAKYVSHQGKRTIFRYMLVNTFCAKSLVSADSPSRFYVLFLPLGNTILENTKEYFLQHLMSILKKKTNLLQKRAYSYKNNRKVILTSQAAVCRCSAKQFVLKISQNSQENTSAGFSFLIKLQSYDLQLFLKNRL